MESSTQERLVGATVLVALAVIVIPALLSGPVRSKSPPEAPPAVSKTYEIDLGGGAPAVIPANEQPVPEADATAASVPAAPSGLPVAGSPSTAATTRAAAAAPATVAAGRAAPAAQAPAGMDPGMSKAPLAAPMPVTEAVSAGPAWAVQLGAFSKPEAAQKLVGELRSRGYAAFILEYRASGTTLHRVRVGPEQDRAKADAVATRLTRDGYKVAVAPHP